MARATRRQSPDKVERRANAKSKRPFQGTGQNVSNSGTRVKEYAEKMKPLEPRTDKQRLLISTIPAYDLTFVEGPAGVGKTVCPIGVALKALFAREIDRIVLTKADFSIDGQWAPVPGDEDDKFKHLFRPMRENFTRFISASHLENLEKLGQVKFEVLANVLGLTFERAYVIFDEAQCSTVDQMKAMLTRMGEHSRYVVCGDPQDQNYMQGRNGMTDAIQRFGLHPSVGRVRFDINDVVRHPFVKDVIQGYRLRPHELLRKTESSEFTESQGLNEVPDFLRTASLVG